MRADLRPFKLLPTIGFALLLASFACEGSKPNASYSKGADKAELFSISSEQMQHVQVLTVRPTTLTRLLRLTGAVAYNAFRTTPVITQISGPVTRVVVVPGQRVTRGDPMLYVASPDYSQLRTNYLKAKDANALAEKAYARSKDLYDHPALSEQALEQAE